MGEMVAFASFGGRAQGYLAVPASGHGPGVVLIQEWWGLVPHIEELAERFAAAGYVTLAPDFYRGVRTTEPDEAQKLMLGLRIREAAEDIAGAAEYLLNRDDVTGPGVGAVGFCMGGGLALLAPTVYSHIVATVGFYPAAPWPDFTPDWSRYAGKEAMIHTAESDGGAAAVAPMAEAIRAGGGEVTVYEYPGSQHAFFNDHRPEVFHAAHSATAWERTLDLLASRLGA